MNTNTTGQITMHNPDFEDEDFEWPEIEPTFDDADDLKWYRFCYREYLKGEAITWSEICRGMDW